MKATRRTVLAGGLSAAALASAPAIRSVQAAPSAARTVKAVMHADLRVLDPIWTTANITNYHGAMVYDTLFGLDGNFQPQPQMVDKFGVSDDKLTYTFQLRDGLKFSDGADVTAADCVASVRRWAARSGAGQTMMKRVKDTPVVDEQPQNDNRGPGNNSGKSDEKKNDNRGPGNNSGKGDEKKNDKNEGKGNGKP